MREIWKDIEGYEGFYQISSTSKVRSLDRFDAIGRFIKGKILSPKLDKDGYYCISLSKNGVGKSFKLHRLVAAHFLPNIENKPCIDHINCIRTDNVVWLNQDGSVNYDKTNLRWVTQKENVNNPLSKSKYNPPHKNGYENPNAKQILQFSKEGILIKKWGCMKDAADSLNINYINISKCCRGIQKQTNGSRWEYYDTEKYLIALMNKNFRLKRNAS